ncbi:MAG TPA: N-acetylmuramoyl-L-alanine amidase [Gaiellaceae bacterium]
MKCLCLAVLLLALCPGTALAAGTTLAAHDVKSRVDRPGHRFDLVGLHWKGSGVVMFRTRSVAGRWSAWRDAAPEDDRPDGRSHELRTRDWNLGSPFWTGPSDRLQVRRYGHVTRVRAFYIWSPASRSRLRAVSIAGSPLILSRASWHADEKIRRRKKPRYADSVRFAVVHHTAGSNSYTKAQSAAIVRGIERYHVLANGWDDIGYNFLVDKYGQIFEGRWGGVDKNVVGAHAQGFNTGSAGVALIGRYDSASITPAARAALIRILAWRLDVAHVDPQSTFSWRSTGNPKYPVGRTITLRTISGHRDTGFTTCPGSQLYGELPSITRAVAQAGLPKLYFPKATGAPGELVRFTGTLTESLPWSVTVTQADGNIVASGAGESASVDWTWDARTVPAGTYLYSIDAGPTVRPALGTIAGPNTRSMLTALAKPGLITPNGDGRSDSALVRYTLREDANVTATLIDSVGTPLTTLFVEAKTRGTYGFGWDATGIADGRYGIVLTARNAIGVETTATLAIIVDRTLAGFKVAPQVFSPNHDGRLDTTRFKFTLFNPARVALSVRRGKKTIGQIYSGMLQPGGQSIEWNGRFARGIGEHEYQADLRVTSPVTTLKGTATFATDTTGPVLKIVSRTVPRFSINEPGDVTVVFDGTRTVTLRRLLPGKFSVPPGGAFTSFAAVARDFAGNDGRRITSP